MKLHDNSNTRVCLRQHKHAFKKLKLLPRARHPS